MKFILVLLAALSIGAAFTIKSVKYTNCQVSFGHILVVPGNEEPDINTVINSEIGCRCSVTIIDNDGNRIQAITTHPVNSKLCGLNSNYEFVEDKISIRKTFDDIRKYFGKSGNL